MSPIRDESFCGSNLPHVHVVGAKPASSKARAHTHRERENIRVFEWRNGRLTLFGCWRQHHLQLGKLVQEELQAAEGSLYQEIQLHTKPHGRTERHKREAARARVERSVSQPFDLAASETTIKPAERVRDHTRETLQAASVWGSTHTCVGKSEGEACLFVTEWIFVLLKCVCVMLFSVYAFATEALGRNTLHSI